MPAFLQAFDNWLDFHIFSTLTASISLLAGGYFAFIYLRQLKKPPVDSTSRFAFMRSSEASDELSRRMVLLGFILWGFGLIAGAMFSKVTWYRYWSFEPRENFSAITYAFYAVVIAGRYVFKWDKKLLAKLAIIGVIVVLFTAIVVDVLGGLHSFQTTAI